MSSTLKAGLFMALESAVNNSLNYDPATQHNLLTLDGKVLHIACTSPAQSVYVLFIGSHVELWSLFEGVADTTLSGTASGFLQLWRVRSNATALTDSGVLLTGDSQLLQQLQHISAQLDIDWEAVMAERTGDIVAHQFGLAVRSASGWLRTAQREAERLMSEFLQFESDTTPNRHDIQRFCNDVDALTLRMDRLQARINAYQSDLHPKKDTP